MPEAMGWRNSRELKGAVESKIATAQRTWLPVMWARDFKAD